MLVMQKELYSMKLGEKIKSRSGDEWTRVPGGWTLGNKHGSTFIPYNNEFQSKKG